ncbi:MAG: hypothetical protein ACO4CH_05065, partial [Saprospiraceae bacterium]
MMPPLHTVLKSVSLFLLIYIFLTAVSTVPQVQRALGTAFGQACLLVAESGFEDMTFRVKPNRNEGRYEYGIRLLYFSDAAIEQARQEAMARGDSRAAVAPPSVVTLELYTFLLVPLFFLWALLLATPPLRLAGRSDLVDANPRYHGHRGHLCPIPLELLPPGGCPLAAGGVE